MKRWVWLLLVLVGMTGICASAQEPQIPLPEGAVARLGQGGIETVVYSLNGEYLTVATTLGVELRRSGTLGLIRFLTGHTNWIVSVAFSPDGDNLCVPTAALTTGP